MDALLRDARHAVRALARHPGFGFGVLLTLAIAIGANAAVFTIVNALMFRPLPYPGQRRIMAVSTTPMAATRRLGASHADYMDWRQARSFESMALALPQDFALGGSGQAQPVSGARASDSLFDVFGLRPALGRVFGEREDRPGGEPVVVLSENLWRQRFEGDPGIIGRDVRLDGTRWTVIGVMPRDFAYPDHAELWVPLARDPVPAERSRRTASVVGRLRPGVAMSEAQAEMRALAATLRTAYPATNDGIDVMVTRLGEGHGPGGIVFAFLLSLAAGGFVLVIASANVANLLLARIARRSREFAIRRAVGASRRHLVRQLLVESFVLALPGCALGLVLAGAARDAILGMVPSGIPTWMRFDIDWRVLAFAAAVTSAAVLISTLSPALRASRRSAVEDLKEAVGSGSAGRSRLRDALVVVEIALTLVLLAGAGLMLRSFLNVASIDPGFPTRNLLTMRLPLSGPRYTPERQRAFSEEAAARISALPGVATAAAGSALPIIAEGWGAGYRVADGRIDRGSDPIARRCAVSPGYFGTLGLPILQGRGFDAHDTPGGMPVAIVTRAFAERHWPGKDPLGRQVRFTDRGDEAPWRTIVGLVDDVRRWRLGDEAALPSVYVPLAQVPNPSLAVAVRTTSDPALVAARIRSELARIDGDVPVVDLMTFDAAIERSLWAEKLFTRVFGVFGGAALCLALVGVYGVVSYSIGQRVREIGIRAALGADRRAIWALVARHGARLSVGGVVLGLIAAPAVTHGMARMLYGVAPYDAPTFLLVSLLLLAVSGAAACIPARRAAAMHPLDALRMQ